MARPTVELVVALRRTAARLTSGQQYKWSHFGQCNCGHLAQSITQLSPREIHAAAFSRSGDWGEQARDYCPTSGLLMDDILAQLFELGMDASDVQQLERLTDREVLAALGRPLLHTRREDVIAYMSAWADLLESRLPAAAAALSPTLCQRETELEAAE
jgi:hypothetical protein